MIERGEQTLYSFTDGFARFIKNASSNATPAMPVATTKASLIPLVAFLLCHYRALSWKQSFVVAN
ncbi:hypothetical protein [Lederbergia citri]|uniref:Uncharacterized protein n=1 Tax=Lederbergia citri TaxID=2833580 RepID=A0A942TFV4_9BACI|nr:hypothetical protein [Lederbergia citri]MBS4196913.1 hypothetical protein [Lederbergia citri]